MQANSLKEAFQGMCRPSAELMRGIVIAVSPVQIKAENDEKLVLCDTLRIPQHLTNYTVNVSIPTSGEHSQYSGTGSHSHTNVSMSINNALKVGEVVYIMALSDGKEYLVIDRAV